jgi:uncharacterized membrane protein
MNKKPNAFRTTVLGGLIFLVPFVVVLLILGKAFAITRTMAAPIAEAIGVDHVGAFALIDMLAVLLLIGVCWLAGHLATSRRGRALYEAFDEKLLNLFPRYGFVKSMTESLASNKGEATLPVVLVRFDDQSQLAFEVERTAGGVVVFLPGSPDPWSGTVSLVTPDRVKRLDVEFKTAVKSIRLLGRGAGQFAVGDASA